MLGKIYATELAEKFSRPVADEDLPYKELKELLAKMTSCHYRTASRPK